VLIHGDARDLPLADQSVQCVVTSPPYWGLRDYGLTPSVWDGAAGCAHAWGAITGRATLQYTAKHTERLNDGWAASNAEREYVTPEHGAFCAHCPAWRGVLGLEPTPELYVAHLVECFREVRRVLRADGTVWLNLGDSYASDVKGSGGDPVNGRQQGGVLSMQHFAPRRMMHGLKPKDLVGIPWRVAFALQADGWYLRADVIWAKPNPMPESVTDRPTKAHEYLFLLAKGERYFYDAEAVREPLMLSTWDREKYGRPRERENSIGKLNRWGGDARSGSADSNPAGRNRRSVWAIATEPYPEAHFATFPEALVAPCILAGTSAAGACARCGAPWERVVEPSTAYAEKLATANARGDWYPRRDTVTVRADGTKHGKLEGGIHSEYHTTGWRPTCACAAQTRPCLVLDPFAGTATVGAVAERLGRAWVGVDLKPEYLALARTRTAQRGLRFTEWRPAAVAANGNGHGRMRQIELVARR
jgi:DNA modification methylase